MDCLTNRRFIWPSVLSSGGRENGLSPPQIWKKAASLSPEGQSAALHNLALRAMQSASEISAPRTKPTDRALQTQPTREPASGVMKVRLAIAEKGDFGVHEQAMDESESISD